MEGEKIFDLLRSINNIIYILINKKERKNTDSAMSVHCWHISTAKSTAKYHLNITRCTFDTY